MDIFNSVSNSEDSNSGNPPNYRLDDDTWCLIIALVQIIGGIVGTGFFIYQLGSVPNSLLVTLVIAPFLGGIYGGVMLWKGKIKGLNYSLLLQAFQILKIMTPLIGYHLYLGIELNVGLFGSDLSFFWELGSRSVIHLNPELVSYGVGVNVIALAAFIYLMKVKRKIILQPVEDKKRDPD